MAATETIQDIADEVARQLASADHFPNMSIIRTPLYYPDGANVLVQLSRIKERFVVTDAADAYLQADMNGLTHTFVRQAGLAAERAGVEFQGHAFLVDDLDRSQLVGAVATIANCAKEAMEITVFEIAKKRYVDARERLVARLHRIFEPAQVTKDATLVGRSNLQWKITALVRSNIHQTAFEPVSDHINSISHVHTKFADLAQIDNAPSRVAVIRNKRKLGDKLNLLSQNSKILDEEVEDAIWLKLAG